MGETYSLTPIVFFLYFKLNVFKENSHLISCFLSLSFIAGCSDKPGFLNCASLPHYGNFCIVHSNWTREYCAKSCGFCGGS